MLIPAFSGVIRWWQNDIGGNGVLTPIPFKKIFERDRDLHDSGIENCLRSLFRNLFKQVSTPVSVKVFAVIRDNAQFLQPNRRGGMLFMIKFVFFIRL